MTITVSEIIKNRQVCEVLEEAFDISFLINERDAKTWFTTASQENFSVIATEGAGGIFLLGSESGVVLYVTSEGQAGVIASALTELLQLVVAHPYWKDLLKFSGNGNLSEMERAVPYLERELLEDQPDIELLRNLVNQKLSLSEVSDSVSSLHHAVHHLAVNIKVLAPDDSECDPLFGLFTINDCHF